MSLNYSILKIENGSKVLVHFHALTSCKEENQSLINCCKENNFTFIGVDLPGQGDTLVIKDIDIPNVLYYAKQAAIRINEINCDEIVISGHSIGAAVAILVTAHSYDKINRLILEAPVSPVLLDNKEEWKNFEKIVTNKTQLTKWRNNKTVWEDMCDVKKGFFKLLGTDLSSERLLKDIKNALNKISDKTMDIIMGVNDHVIPVQKNVDYFKHICKGELNVHVVENAGHMVHNENKQAYEQIINKILANTKFDD